MTQAQLVFGPSGAGKTTVSKKLAAETNAVRFSIDEWMVRLFGADLPVPLTPEWIFPRVHRCEEQIWATAADLLKLGMSVVLDLGFMRVSDRQRFIGLAATLQIPYELIFVTASQTVRRDRVSARNLERGDTFALEVTPQMFEFAEQMFEDPTVVEIEEARVYET